MTTAERNALLDRIQGDWDSVSVCAAASDVETRESYILRCRRGYSADFDFYRLTADGDLWVNYLEVPHHLFMALTSSIVRNVSAMHESYRAAARAVRAIPVTD